MSVCPAAGGEHVDCGKGGSAVYEHPPLTQAPGDSWHLSGGLVQSAPVQQFEVGMQVLPQSLSPDGHAQPEAVHCSPPVHAGAPLHVQPPAVHVLVVAPAQSLLVQHSPDGMHAPSHDFCPDGHAHPAPVHTCPPAHGIAPLQVQVPPLHVFVVAAVQSALVQQLAEGMHDVPQRR